MKRKAFTLVELIVVITILAILGTIAFISLSGYSKEARDAKRVTDTSSLLSKINIEETRGTLISDLITETDNVYLQILGKSGSLVKTFGEADFKNLKENEKNFRDPSNKNQNYPLAYAIGGKGRDSYKFIQIATISEKENKNIIKGNYYRSENPDDAPSLFRKGTTDYTEEKPPLLYELDNSGSSNNLGKEEEIGEQKLELLYRVGLDGNYGIVISVSSAGMLVNLKGLTNEMVEECITDPSGICNRDYLPEGDYIVEIRPFYEDDRWGINEYSLVPNGNLIEVKAWNNINWSSLKNAFKDANNLEKIPNKAPNLEDITDLSGMFSGATKFNQDISSWDVSTITNMNSIFENASSFNQNLSSWDVSNVTDYVDFDKGATSWETKNKPKFK